MARREIPAGSGRIAAPVLAGALAGCAASGPAPDVVGQPTNYRVEVRADGLAVARIGHPFHYSEGLAARRAAEVHCSRLGRHLVTGFYDRYEAGSWVFPGGCA